MSANILSQIQALQFTDKRAAEGLLVPFIRETFGLDVVAAELRPLAVSLNSFNGFATLGNGERLFFKTHIEADNVIDEFYNADLLGKTGYPVLQALYESKEAGRQFLIYPVMDCPSVFDAAWEIETGAKPFDPQLETAQNLTDDVLFSIYEKTLHQQTAAESASAPVHQLFYHRLTGGRLERFYGENTQIEWEGQVIPIRDLRRARWTINGRSYSNTLDELIERAIRLLNPSQSGAAVVGHGDAHNGNVFYCSDGEILTYFDPAFAGDHHPLLDLTKPLFHNVFAMWMYHPHYFDERMTVTLRRDGDDWHLDHNFPLHPVRTMFLNSKVQRVLKPTLNLLHEKGLLREDWQVFLQSSLMCCPLLTMNLTDATRFPTSIGLLGFAMAVEMGSNAEGLGLEGLL